MPVAPPSSFFSSIRHAFQSSPHPSAVAPDPPPAPAPSSSSHEPHRLQLYQMFESNLAQRLASLSPSPDALFVTMPFLKQFLHVLLATQADLQLLLPAHQYPLSQAQVRMMDEFLERSVKLLDVCRDIKQQILDLQSFQGMLQWVLGCLSAKNGGLLHVVQVVRARKALAELLLGMETERTEEPPLHLYRSFRCRGRENVAGDSGPEVPQRRRSWHGSGRLSTHSSGSSSPASQPTRQLQAIGAVLTAPRMAAGDVEDCLGAAIYALNVVSIFFLGTLTISLPGLNKTYVQSFVHPRNFLWASSLSYLQEQVQEELKWRGKKGGSYAAMWELDQISTIVQRLFELIEDEDCTLGDKAREEIKNLVKQLKQYVEELDKDLAHLYTQLMDFYNRIISSRMETLDMLRKFKP